MKKILALVGLLLVLTGCSMEEKYNIKIVDLTRELSQSHIEAAESIKTIDPVVLIFSNEDVPISSYADTEDEYGILILPTEVIAKKEYMYSEKLDYLCECLAKLSANKTNAEALVDVCEEIRSWQKAQISVTVTELLLFLGLMHVYTKLGGRWGYRSVSYFGGRRSFGSGSYHR